MAMERINISGIEPVCKPDCHERSWDCHGRCEKYKAYRAECDKAMEKRYQEKQFERDVSSEISEAVKRLGHGRSY